MADKATKLSFLLVATDQMSKVVKRGKNWQESEEEFNKLKLIKWL